MQVQPLFDRIHVRVPEEKKEMDGGIELPDTHSADRPQRGTVVAKGPEADAVQLGDEVVFRKYSPDEITIDGEKVYLLEERDCIAVIR